MNNKPMIVKPVKRVTILVGLIFAISLSVYFCASFVPQDMVMLVGSTLSFAPLIATLILVFRKNRMDGIRKLLKRALNAKGVRDKIWYVPILLLMPLIFLLGLGISFLLGDKIPATLTPAVATPLVLFMFFLLALSEEVAWTGYAFDTLHDRWSALGGSLVLGIIWGMWHLPLYYLAGFDPVWIGGQFVGLVFFRILIVWIYVNTGKSLFAAILFHAVYNVCTMMIPGFSARAGHIAINFLIIVTAIVVGIVWDRQTMCQSRYNKKLAVNRTTLSGEGLDR